LLNLAEFRKITKSIGLC